MKRYRFFNLRSAETEHCFAWLVGGGADLKGLVHKARAQAMAEVDGIRDGRAWILQDPRNREALVAEVMTVTLADALRELLEQRLGEYAPSAPRWPPLNWGDSTCEDPCALVGGLVAHAWRHIDFTALAGAVRRHVVPPESEEDDDSECPLCDRPLDADSPLCGACEAQLDQARERLVTLRRRHDEPPSAGRPRGF